MILNFEMILQLADARQPSFEDLTKRKRLTELESTQSY